MRPQKRLKRLSVELYLEYVYYTATLALDSLE